MSVFTFEIVCRDNYHPQGTQNETAPDEFAARKNAILKRIKGQRCDICGSPLQFHSNGNPKFVDGQPPVRRAKP